MNNTFCLAIFMGLCYFKQLACATYYRYTYHGHTYYGTRWGGCCGT